MLLIAVWDIHWSGVLLTFAIVIEMFRKTLKNYMWFIIHSDYMSWTHACAHGTPHARIFCYLLRMRRSHTPFSWKLIPKLFTWPSAEPSLQQGELSCIYRHFLYQHMGAWCCTWCMSTGVNSVVVAGRIASASKAKLVIRFPEGVLYSTHVKLATVILLVPCLCLLCHNYWCAMNVCFVVVMVCFTWAGFPFLFCSL